MLYAHTSKDKGQKGWEPLAEHLQKVAKMAAGFAAAFRSENWADLLGHLHDLGKARASFRDICHNRMERS